MKSKIFLMVTGLAIAIGFNVKKAQAEVYSQAGIKLEQDAGKNNRPITPKKRKTYKLITFDEIAKLPKHHGTYFEQRQHTKVVTPYTYGEILEMFSKRNISSATTVDVELDTKTVVNKSNGNPHVTEKNVAHTEK
jgi:hypothetical protein